MHLRKTRHAARLAELALSELETNVSTILSATWSGGHETARDMEMQADLRIHAALVMVHRVGYMLDHETKGKRRDTFGPWWEALKKNPLYRQVNGVRNAELKRGEQGLPGTVIVFQYNEDEPAGTTQDPRIVLRSIDLTGLLRQYLSWCESDLIPEAEERTF